MHDSQSDAHRIDAVVARSSDKVDSTLELDVFDPAIMPSTGAPQSGGLFRPDVMGLRAMVTRRKDRVGCAVVAPRTGEDVKAPDCLYRLSSLQEAHS